MRMSAPSALASRREPWGVGTASMSPKVASTTPGLLAIARAAAMSERGQMQTGQPGPAMTLTLGGRRPRTAKRLIARSWVPQTCMILTDPRPSAAFAARAERERTRSLRRNSSWAGRPAGSLIYAALVHGVDGLAGVVLVDLGDREARVD